MNNGNNLPTINTAADNLTGRTNLPETIELLQQLGDRVTHANEELALRIRKQAETEATRLIEGVNVQVREIVSKAQSQVKMATEKESAKSVSVQENIGKHTLTVAVKKFAELLPTLDYLAEMAKAMEQALRVATTETGDNYSSKEREEPAEQKEANESNSDLEFNLQDIIGSKDATGVKHSALQPTGTTALNVELEEHATLASKLPQEKPDMFHGEVEIDIVPPVNIRRLLGLLRSLENTKGIRILGTLGSRNSGSVITLSLDNPIALLSIIRDMPMVEDVVEGNELASSSAPEQSDVRMISVVTRG